MAKGTGDEAATYRVPLPLPAGLADGFGRESVPTTEVDSPQVRWVPGSRATRPGLGVRRLVRPLLMGILVVDHK
ncbi:hypothetical protein GCM10009734_23680 [Nonomuraea bangladeshensis]